MQLSRSNALLTDLLGRRPVNKAITQILSSLFASEK
jgi:hypothetical protein